MQGSCAGGGSVNSIMTRCSIQQAPSYISGGSGTVANGESVGSDALDGGVGVKTDPDASPQCDSFNSKDYTLRN
jgi:hypothetical protein